MSSQPEHRADEAGPSSQVAEVPEGLPAIGEVLAGKYRIERVLGIGGMGVVLAAMHLHLGERVALKFLLPSVATAETVERFAREARAAARIKSEHVARVTDVSQTEAGATYMVMEFLEGSDLSDVLRDSGPLPLRDAVEYIIQASDAIADAHAMGIVHRDLKPANLFLARRPGAPARIKVLDFGISKITPTNQGDQAPIYQQRAMTHTRAWLGSPLYMAPEQMKSAKGVDGRTDIWSLGVILFELLAGTAPFTGGNLPELCAEILHGKPADLLSKRAEVPRELDEVIRKCLEKDPSLRFQNVAELVMALVDFAPRRARSVAERAVSLIEGAGMMRKSMVPRAALDSTLAGDGLGPRESVAPPSSLRLEEPSIPRPPRTPSFAPDQLANVGQAATMVAPPPGVDTESGTRRRSAALVPILVVITLVASVAVTFLLLSRRASQNASAPDSAPSAGASIAPTGAPAATNTAPAPPAPTHADTSAPTASAAPPPTSAPAASTTAAAPSATATAKLFGRLPSAASASAKARPTAAPTSKPAPVPAKDNGGDLRVETCHEEGTGRVVPCP